ncbi:hypothetical protein H8M03_12570 [Sphingomonas sabuli]|uniref:Uncharacterized protein n=1 Tax=Sphingomonas sabuli TaxID=2764186 RepID=A0A7G9L2E8_9SPHN|nr:hypothetical protein [Sphingomonas sabuli]QNM82797.1 hypothetical protein H8M03_12570 [Sphingomonas sabuli]
MSFEPILPDADADRGEGRAALLLVESLIHELIARSVLTLPTVLEILDVAIDAGAEMAADEAGRQNGDLAARARDILHAVRTSIAAS